MSDCHEKPDRAAWIKGPCAACSTPAKSSARNWRLVLLGAPGVGKGTQAQLLSEQLGACHLSTGDIFRAAKTMTESERSPAMSDALNYMKRGDLVPDSTVLALIGERTGCLRCIGGFLLDGFPRTLAQAEVLEARLAREHIALDAVIDYRLPIEQIITRLSGRRTCPNCKAVFHVTDHPPTSSGICDHCGMNLIQREDDRPESVRVRMEAYATSTAPLTDFFQKLGLLVAVDAAGSPQEVLARTIEALQSRASAAALPAGL